MKNAHVHPILRDVLNDIARSQMIVARACARPVRCLEGRLLRHDPQFDDPDLETDIGECPACRGKGCAET
jgi:hypothetical protein